MRNIAIFYHCLFFIEPPRKALPIATWIVQEQMDQLESSGLLRAAVEFHVGVNGGPESKNIVAGRIPSKARVTYHGLQMKSENPTILMLEEWVKTHHGWDILYFHSKGATKPIGGPEGMMATHWRNGMMHDLVSNWRKCVGDLSNGYDIVCSSWLWNQLGGIQHIPAGNFLWVTSDFASKLPSILSPARIKSDGLGALTSRYEAEVYWGNGPKPKVQQYRGNPHWYHPTTH